MANRKELDHCYEFVLNLTKESAKIIRDAFQGIKNIETKAGDWDLVTQFDRKVEEVLIAGLIKEFPSHKFIGEETVSSSNDLPALTDSPTWIIDPIDGTTNFVHAFPHTCISIALMVKKNLEIGIVYNPLLEQMFTARWGHGAFLNGKRIRSSQVDGTKFSQQNAINTATKRRRSAHSAEVVKTALDAVEKGISLREASHLNVRNSLICIESSYATIASIRDIVLGRLEAFVSVAHGIRTLGSAALTLCYVAMGAAEAYNCDNLMPWDVAAGVLIIREAGGAVIDTLGGEFNIMKPKTLAVGNEKLARDLVKLIAMADSSTLRKRGAD